MTVYRRSPDAYARRVGDETVLLHLQTEQYHSLNPTGTLLWEHLEHGATVSELITVLTDHFAIDEDQATADVEAFLASVTERQLVTAQ